MSHHFDPLILREYDIRGVVGKNLNAADLLAVGKSFGTIVRRRGGTDCVLGYDGRLTSPELAAAMAEGLQSVGLKVIRIGLGPTPMTYFGVKHLGAAAGVMITGSHNPPEYNGIKMTIGGAAVYGEMVQQIGQMAAKADWDSGQGSLIDVDIQDAYVDRLVQDYQGARDLRIAWDAGNGAAGEVLRRLVKKLPGTHFLLFDEIDGTFPNHHPDPTIPENLVDLQKLVRDEKCDLGIGFDGDADRIGAVDNLGRIIWGDQLVAIYASDVLAAQPGATVIADVKASQSIFDEIARLGGKPLMWKTGHSLLKAKMAEIGAPLAGEMSGHIFFADKYYGFDDALYCGVRLASLLSNSSGTMADIKDRLPQTFNTPEVRFQVDESRKFAVIEEVKQRLTLDNSMQVNDIDGVRVNTADGWWLLRASNTQDVLVLRAESTSPAGLERLKTLLSSQLTASGLTPPDMNHAKSAH